MRPSSTASGALAHDAAEVLDDLVVRCLDAPGVVHEVPREVDGRVALGGEAPVEQDEPVVLERDVLVAHVSVDERRTAPLELAQAESWADPERAARAREETDFVTSELAAAVGLGGRNRRAADAAERARMSVTKAIRTAIRRITAHDPQLGEHLAKAVRTGTLCSYDPDPQAAIHWDVRTDTAPAKRE